MNTYILRKLAQAVTFLCCIREITGSNLDSETGYPDRGFYVVFLSLSRQILGQYSKLYYDSYLPNHVNLLVSDHPTPFYTMQSELLISPLSKPKINK
jgi:hypothetical protein